MHPAVEVHAGQGVTDVPSIVRGAVKLGLIESVGVLLFSVASRFLPSGPVETIVLALILLAGLAAVTLLPGIWTRSRNIDGIASAAGIGLAATVVFLLIDVAILQNIGTYTNRWYQIGGGSNWWYHPVWWMVGTFIPWMGAWILANQAEKSGHSSPVAAFAMTVACGVVVAVVAVLTAVPAASWALPTFAIAYLPGLALATALSAMGRRRG